MTAEFPSGRKGQRPARSKEFSARPDVISSERQKQQKRQIHRAILVVSGEHRYDE